MEHTPTVASDLLSCAIATELPPRSPSNMTNARPTINIFRLNTVNLQIIRFVATLYKDNSVVFRQLSPPSAVKIPLNFKVAHQNESQMNGRLIFDELSKMKEYKGVNEKKREENLLAK
jgi:hypothetical protein